MHLVKRLLAALLFFSPALATAQSLPSPHFQTITLNAPMNAAGLPAFAGGDCTTTAGSVALNCTKTGGVAFGYFATGTNAANLTGTVAIARLPANPSAGVYYVSSAGNNSNDGLSFWTPKQTLQAGIDAANPNGTVLVVGGTFTLSAGLAAKPGVSVQCMAGATITQANGANLTYLIDADFAAAHKFKMNFCTVDGNAANNTLNFGAALVFIGNSNDVSLQYNYFRNCPGIGVQVKNGVRWNVDVNDWSGSCFVAPFAAGGSTAQTVGVGSFCFNKIAGSIGQHAVIINWIDHNSICNNKIVAPIVAGMVVNTLGTAVSWVSGPTFSGLTAGQFLTINGGSEYLITSVNSSTSLTLYTSAGTNSGVAAVGGPGDLLSLASASFNTISGNDLTGGGAGGVVWSNNSGTEDARNNTITSNIAVGQAQSCYGASTISNGTYLDDTLVTGNTATNCGAGRTAVAAVSRSGFGFAAFTTPGLFGRTSLLGNQSRDNQGTPTIQYWMAIDGSNTPLAGVFSVANNEQNGAANDGVQNGILSVVPAAGWGTGATVTNIKSWGSTYSFTINSGTGTTASPAVTINTNTTSFENTPIVPCFIQNSTNATVAYGFNNSGRAGQTYLYQGTPPASTANTFYCKG